MNILDFNMIKNISLRESWGVGCVCDWGVCVGGGGGGWVGVCGQVCVGVKFQLRNFALNLDCLHIV